MFQQPSITGSFIKNKIDLFSLDLFYALLEKIAIIYGENKIFSFLRGRVKLNNSVDV